jgi:hypothetical protein
MSELMSELRRKRPGLDHLIQLNEFQEKITGRDFFGIILLEEAQHMFADSIPHKQLETAEDFGKYIEHSPWFTNMHTLIADYSESIDTLIAHILRELKKGNEDKLNLNFSEIRTQLAENIIRKKRYLASSVRFGLSADYIVTLLEESLTDRARIVLADTQRNAKTFLEKKNQPISFVLNDSLPKSIYIAIERELTNANLTQIRIIPESEFIKEKDDFRRHFVFYLGITASKIDTTINQIQDKVVLLFGNDHAAFALASIHTEFLRLALMAKMISEYGSLSSPPKKLSIADIFTNYDSLSDATITRLETAHQFFEDRLKMVEGSA